MGIVNVELKEYNKAPDGSLLIKRNGKWNTTTVAELLKPQADIIKALATNLEALCRNSKHFTKYAKSHFMVAFNTFKIKVLTGEIDMPDEETMKLGDAVLNDEITVANALEKDVRIKDIFTKIYLSNKDMVEFPEV